MPGAISAETAPGEEATSEPEEPAADAADQAPIEPAGDSHGVPTTHGRDRVASAADPDALQALIEPAGGLRRAEATCGCDRAAPVSDPEAGQAVIEQAGGLHVGARAARRIACDAGLVVVHHGADGGVLDVGRRTRTIPTALRRALESRDRNQCQFPGCTSRHCDAHHVVHWADGGETKLSNLALVCRFHHRALHEEGFRVVAAGAGQFQFLRPDGEPLPAVAPTPRWEGAGEPLAPTVARLEADGISIGPHTATPDWYGEPLDVTAALDVLWEPPGREAPVVAGVGGGRYNR